jgi:hypothetical protein
VTVRGDEERTLLRFTRRYVTFLTFYSSLQYLLHTTCSVSSVPFHLWSLHKCSKICRVHIILFKASALSSKTDRVSSFKVWSLLTRSSHETCSFIAGKERLTSVIFLVWSCTRSLSASTSEIFCRTGTSSRASCGGVGVGVLRFLDFRLASAQNIH